MQLMIMLILSEESGTSVLVGIQVGWFLGIAFYNQIN